MCFTKLLLLPLKNPKTVSFDFSKTVYTCVLVCNFPYNSTCCTLRGSASKIASINQSKLIGNDIQNNDSPVKIQWYSNCLFQSLLFSPHHTF